MIDTAAITGESVPREAAVGDEVISGCINLNGRLKIKVTRDFGQSTVAKILDLVENASSQKASVENFITRLHAIIRRRGLSGFGYCGFAAVAG